MKPRTTLAIVVAILALVYAPKAIFPEAEIYRADGFLSARRLEVAGVLARLALLVAGGGLGLRSALRLEPTNPARRPWFLFGLWLSAFAIGQAGLAYYSLLLHATPPLPSFGDYAFLFGYGFGIAGTVAFIRCYHASGFPIGSATQHAALAVVAAMIFAAAGVPLLAPIVHADVSAGERAINTAYPVLDFIALAVSIVMIRIAVAFRGGRVATIWTSILAGWIFMAAGDIAFAWLTSAKKESLTPLVDLTLTLGYFFAAFGMQLQLRLLAEPKTEAVGEPVSA